MGCGPCKDLDVDLECLDLDISLASSNEEPRSGIGLPSSNARSDTQHASSSIFEEDYDDADEE